MKLHFAYGGDWEAVYLDGKLLLEGHSIDGQRLAEALADHLRPNRHQLRAG